MKALLLVSVLALLAGHTLANTPAGTIRDPAAPIFPNLQNDPLFSQRTYEKLRELPVDISWNNVPLQAALRDLVMQALRSDPDRESLIFRFSTDSAPEARQRSVSLAARQASVFSVLENLGTQASFQIRVHKNIVLIEPRPVANTVP